MSLVKITSEGITDGSIVNADLHSAANIASSKLADSGVSAATYGSATAIPAITINAKGIVTAVSTNSVNTTTNLGVSTSTTAVTVTSSTGDNAAISEASGSAAGVMSVTHHDKLDGIESGATADQTASEILTALLTVDGISSGIVATSAGGVDVGGVSTNSALQIVFSTNGDGSGRTIACSSGSDDFTYNPSSKTLVVEGSITAGEALNATRTTDNATTSVITNNGLNGGHCLKLSSGGTGAGTSIFSVFRNNQSSEAEVFKIDGAGTVDITGNLDVSAGVDVTGNITVSGTVDGRDVQSDGSKLDGIASGATNVTNNNQLTNGAGYTTFDGNYNSLSNRPTIPTNNNQLTNGAGYITSATNNYANSASFNTGNGVLTIGRSGLGSLTVDLDGRYSTSSVSTSQLAKAFVNFDQRSSQSIRNSYNVSSLTDNGTGKTTVNFSSGVGSNPTVQATSSWGDGSRAGWCGLTPDHTPSSSNCRIFSQQPSTYAFMDAVFLCVTVHRS